MTTQESILLIDTTGDTLLVALVSADKVETRTSTEKRRHSEVLNIVAGDWVRVVDAYAVVVGGREGQSWTGSRVGVVAVKAWAFATGKPVIILDSVDFSVVRDKYTTQQFASIHDIQPEYSSEFKITIKN